MKKILLLVAVVIAILVSDNIQAQVSVNFDVNIRRQPVWGPTGYDHVEYYYFPDIECYYYVSKGRFVYFDNGEWRFASQLPGRFGNYDLDHAYKVVVNDFKPYLNHPYYRDKYARVIVEHHEPQPVIRESSDPRYYQIKEHPRHGEWRNYRDKYDRDRR
jgi:hypothetical protein